jgi:hypothetical protein
MRSTKFKVALFFGLSGVQAAAYIAVFGIAFAMGDAGVRAPLPIIVLVNILGTPLMWLLRVDPKYFAPWGRWWGDDGNFIIGLAFLNSMVWGLMLTSGFSIWRSRRNRTLGIQNDSRPL